VKKSTGFPVAFLGVAFLVTAVALPLNAQRFSDWSAPVNLGPAVNTAASESCAEISKDGLTFYFARGGIEILFTERTSLDGPWGTPQKLPETINVAGSSNFCPVLSADRHALYFVSDRPGGCGETDMYVSYRRKIHDNLGWETPVNLGCQVNSPQADLRPSPFEGEDGTGYLYFSSTRPGGPGAAGTSDIYSATMQPDGTFGLPVLVEGLNTTANDSRPDVRERDGLEVFFDSSRPGGAGAADLWTSTRASLSDPWSTPVNLGPVVNGTVNELRPSLSWDGTALYFQSPRSGGAGSADLYVTTRTKLTGYVFPSSANVLGLNGAEFRTSMKLLNLNPEEVTISAALMTPSGAEAARDIVLPASSYRTFDNFLHEVFGYSGGAGIRLSGDASRPFIAVAEVSAGVYSTQLASFGIGDAVARSESAATSVAAGLRVTPGTRANFGCSNLDPDPVTVRVDFSAMSNGARATADAELNLGPSQWVQRAVSIPGKEIFAFFSVTSGGGPRGVYCWGVNVDNVSNDAAVISAVRVP
jgi:hypothetical protein